GFDSNPSLWAVSNSASVDSSVTFTISTWTADGSGAATAPACRGLAIHNWDSSRRKPPASRVGRFHESHTASPLFLAEKSSMRLAVVDATSASRGAGPSVTAAKKITGTGSRVTHIASSTTDCTPIERVQASCQPARLAAVATASDTESAKPAGTARSG